MERASKIIQYFIAGLLFAGIIAGALLFTTDHPRYDLIFEDTPMILKALLNTLAISIVTLVLSMLLGFLLFLMARARLPFIRAVAVIFKEIIMGTPLLVMVFLGVYVLGDFIHVSNKTALGILALTLYMSPYLTNAYETAVAVVDADQYTVMELYHFSGFQKYRYVILPQMIRPLIPSLINNLSSMIKGSALLKVVSVSEISYVITVVSAKNWAAIEGYYVMWLSYLIVTIPLSILAQYVGKRVEK